MHRCRFALSGLASMLIISLFCNCAEHKPRHVSLRRKLEQVLDARLPVSVHDVHYDEMTLMASVHYARFEIARRDLGEFLDSSTRLPAKAEFRQDAQVLSRLGRAGAEYPWWRMDDLKPALVASKGGTVVRSGREWRYDVDVCFGGAEDAVCRVYVFYCEEP